MTSTYVHCLALGLDPAWRREPDADRRADADALSTAVDGLAPGQTFAYSTIGLQPGIDLILWRLAPSFDDLETAAATVLRTGLGRWLTVRESLVGRIGSSQYVARPTSQEQSLFEGERSRYLIVYPFTKTTEWYLLAKEVRQGAMNEHMRIGRSYPQVRQLLAYSFGLDDQDFIVAYETDDLPAFGDLVRELRATEARRSTAGDTPILTAVHRPIREILGMLGADATEMSLTQPAAELAGVTR